MGFSNRRRLALVGVVALGAVTLSGCLQDPDAGGGGATGTTGVADNSSADGDGKVTILGAYGGDEKANFEKALAPFEKESGIDIEYTEDTDFTTTIKTRVAAGDAPDIGFFPQPGGLLELAAQGRHPAHRHLPGHRDAARRPWCPACWSRSRLTGDPTGDDAVAGAGRMYGAPMRLANKSLVWYPKKAWDAAGYEVPKTLDELYALADQIKQSGITPWCMAWNADQATGWVGTDWIEQEVLSLVRPRRLQRVDLARDPVRRPADRGGVRRVRQDRQDRRSGLRRRADGGQHPGRRVDGPGVPQPARVHARAAGLLRDLVPLARHPGRPRQRGRGLPVPGQGGRRRGSADPRWRRPRRALQRQRRGRHQGDAVPDLRQVRGRVGPGRRVDLAAQDLRRRPTTPTRPPRTSPTPRPAPPRSSSTAPT